jgi:hypothetical protein
MSPSQTAVLVVAVVFAATVMAAIIVAAVIMNRRHASNLELLEAKYGADVAPFYAALTLSGRTKAAGPDAPDASPTESRAP